MEEYVKKLLFLVLMLCILSPEFINAESTGIITGVIVDSKTGEPLIDAGVEVLEIGKKAFTDVDGKFNITLPPGKYEIRVFYPQYQGQRVKDITVTPGKPARVDLSLAPKEADIQVVEVVVEAVKATEATQLLIRKKAPAVTDSVSAETIAKQPDSDIASVVERAPGITIVDDKFVYIRGLGERYTSASLNDTALPSTQTEKKVVPLDLFSADVVDSVNVVKSYTPDLPGEFTAGVVQITTKDYPDTFEMKFSASAKYNTETTGKDFKTYKGGDWDWLGIDDGTRELPDIIPGKKVIGGNFTPEELERFGEDFDNIWNTQTKTAPPSYGGNFHIGNKFNNFGIVFDVTYDADYETTDEELFSYTPQAGNLLIQKDQDFSYWEEKITWSGILNMGYEFSPNHKISLKNFYTKNTTDQVRTSKGFVDENKFGDAPETDQINTKTGRLLWSEEEIYSGQLSGRHYFAGLPLITPIKGLSSTINWRLGYGYSSLDEPDMREVTYSASRTYPHDFMFYSSGKSGSRTYTELDEDNYEAGFDWELDFTGLIGHPLKAKFGPAYSYRDRTFDYRTFQFSGSFMGIDLTRDPESIFNPINIHPDGIQLQENTHPSDHYDADLRITAGYFMIDTPYFLFKNLRFVGGLRVEVSDLNLDGYDHSDTSPPFTEVNIKKEDTDFFPSVNLIYSLTKDMNLRFGFSRTVNRPEFREIAPFLYRDSATGIETIGNPDLERALVTSYDLRWEWFLSSEDLLAISVFYKDLEDPIERTREISSSTVFRSTFQNSLKAENYGFEIEARKNLGFIHSLLSPFSIFANYTYVDSNVDIKPAGIHTVNMTSQNRPLQGQSDHVANIILEYTHKKWDLTARLLYNYVGERISDVGVLGLPDIIEEPTNWLDFILIKRIKNWSMKFSAKNLLDEEVLFTQGGKTYQRYKEGLSVSFSLSYGI
jgi:outer membrane receptor protein involved in Fe transport